MKRITKTDVAKLIEYIFIWMGISFIGDFLFFHKRSWHNDLLESILGPAITATIVWILIEWKPWEKDRNTERWLFSPRKRGRKFRK